MNTYSRFSSFPDSRLCAHAYLFTQICDPRLSTCCCFHGHLWTEAEWRKIQGTQCSCSARLTGNKVTPPHCSSSCCKPASFPYSVYHHMFPFLYFIVILLFKTAPKPSAEVLFSAPERKKAVMCLAEKIHVLGKLYQTGVTVPSASSLFVNQWPVKYGVCKHKTR